VECAGGGESGCARTDDQDRNHVSPQSKNKNLTQRRKEAKGAKKAASNKQLAFS
jgi:hypothetical protein